VYITLLKHNADAGQLLSITDSVRLHPPGCEYHDSSTGAIYKYCYNGNGAACVANNMSYLACGAGLTNNPRSLAIADGQGYELPVMVAQAAIPSTYWGWFQIYGPSRERVYFDCIDQDATKTVTDGEPLEIQSGILCDDTSVDWAVNRLHCVLASEARSSATTAYMWIMGGNHLATA